MKADRFLAQNAGALNGKTVAVTGTTGGLGRPLCLMLAQLGAELILLDRNPEKSLAFAQEIRNAVSAARVQTLTVDLADFSSVQAATRSLGGQKLDFLIHNAGAYSIPRKICDTGLDNVFQINFASPYYMIRQLLPNLRQTGGRVVVVGSIAHRYSQTDPADPDFSTRRQARLCYGNAKRYLMFGLYELFSDQTEVTLSVCHPGISFTNITAHYPKLLFAVIKYPMKLIFMHPKKACLSILAGVFTPCANREWIGPRLFDIWGSPKKRRLRSCSPEESAQIAATAETIYQNLLEK